eukprot:scaffold1150_cov152-Amphora_coffeaeformis.AAC.7
MTNPSWTAPFVEQGSGRVQFYNATQRDALGLVTLVSAALSTVGSLWVCGRILGDPKRLMADVYQRLVLGMSLTTILWSMALMTSPWMVPATERDYNVSFAKGTVASCQASGFFLTYWFGTMIYMAMLCLYYACASSVSFSRRKGHSVEPWAHGLALGYPTLLGIHAVHAQLYNPLPILPGICIMTIYPLGCDEMDDLECTRGIDGKTASNLNTLSLSVIWIIILACLTTMMRSTCRSRLLLSYNHQHNDVSRLHFAFRHTLFYGLSCFVTSIPIFMAYTVHVEAHHQATILAVAVLATALSPTFGIWMAWIYFSGNSSQVQQSHYTAKSLAWHDEDEEIVVEFEPSDHNENDMETSTNDRNHQYQDSRPSMWGDDAEANIAICEDFEASTSPKHQQILC